MKLTKEELLALVYETMEEVNYKLETEFTKENVEIAFFVPDNGIEVYENFCGKYFPKCLRESYTQKGFFETFAAQAFVGNRKDGILIREDLNFTRAEWHHTILHELSHILLYKEEIGGESFFDKYCINYEDNEFDDGCINAGYAIWREFLAETYAMELDDSVLPYRLDDAKCSIKKLSKYIRVKEPNAKEAMRQLLNVIFKSDDYSLSRTEDEFIERIRKTEVQEILVFEYVFRLIYEHFQKGCSYKIDVDFIYELGYRYLYGLTSRVF